MPDETHNFDLPPTVKEPLRRRSSSLIGIALLGALATVFALIAADVVLINGVHSPAPRRVVNVVRLSDSSPIERTVDLSVSPSVKPGPNGKLHDAFSITNFTVRAGQSVKLVINNTDTSDHSITAMGAGVNIIVRPGLHTYTLLLHKQGRFEWICTYPCDPYSMAHLGYMRGYITSV